MRQCAVGCRQKCAEPGVTGVSDQVAVVIRGAVSLHLGAVRIDQGDEGRLLDVIVFKVRHVSRGDGERILAVRERVKGLHTAFLYWEHIYMRMKGELLHLLVNCVTNL